MGLLKHLESLDSLADLSSISSLDLSNNDLSGRIPSSTQLQRFDASAYIGNPELCGLPLTTKCSGDETVQTSVSTAGTSEDKYSQTDRKWYETSSFYISLALGFISGFWGVCGTLLFYRSWRRACFHFLDDMGDKLYVTIAINVARLQRRFQAEEPVKYTRNSQEPQLKLQKKMYIQRSAYAGDQANSCKNGDGNQLSNPGPNN
ncbi:hypothetical protein RJ640_025396 [Escallonia rubra]|uniref:Uncharacterized protein n=1 Tax=Escallonia rubra TaxID=112253 RepID=A0AA88S349_9ASTE|nr:hypothetical protein RJ640_025396 [Escallonia rubra]